MKFAKLSVASACALVVGCGGSSQTEEVVSPDSAVTLEQVERFDQAERLRWRQADSTAPQLTVSGQTGVDLAGSVGLSGKVTDNKAVYSVKWTNDRGGSGRAGLSGAATDANWSAAGIQLQTGSNKITLVAEDVAGNSTTMTTVVSRSASAPAPAPAPSASPAAAPRPAASPSPAPAPAPTPAPAPAAAAVNAALTLINAALMPASAAGSNARRINNSGEMPYRDHDGMGAFRTVCGYSHMNFDDPLVYPGQPGRAHLHVFFGNTAVNANSTPESIRNSGNGSCRGGTVNRSAYWAPAMVDSSTGRPIRPRDDNDIYYKTGYSLFGQNSQVNAFPVGFRMIALDSKSRVPQSKAHFECNGAQTGTIPNCPNGELRQVIAFPQCWDGVNLSSPDHRSHVVYANNGSCPSTHPVHFPEITMIIKYDVPASGSANWRLSSDINGTPAGSSSHADWVNGWEQEVMNTFVTRVIRQGMSGGSHIVGDGRTIF